MLGAVAYTVQPLITIAEQSSIYSRQLQEAWLSQRLRAPAVVALRPIQGYCKVTDVSILVKSPQATSYY